MMTARPVRSHGVCTNGDELPASIPTFLHALQRHGYRTRLSGKAHFIGPDQLHGFDDRLTTDIYPSDFIWERDWDLAVQHNPGTSVDKLDIPGTCRTNLQLRYDLEAKNRAVEFLHDHVLEGSEQPFFLMASFTQPHEPFITNPKYWDLYEGAELTSLSDDPPSPLVEHPHNRSLAVYHGIDRNPPDDDRRRRAVRAHLAMISHIDDYVGELLDTLDTLGLKEDTIVVFASDHGEMLGTHGMWFKRTFFEESARVPLIVRIPGGAEGKVAEDVVSLVDLGPTIMDLAGCPDRLDSPGVIGKSLASALTGAGQADTYATIDYLGDGTSAPMFAIRRGRWKYVAFETFEPILIDLQDDPHGCGFPEATRRSEQGTVEEMHKGSGLRLTL